MILLVLALISMLGTIRGKSLTCTALKLSSHSQDVFTEIKTLGKTLFPDAFSCLAEPWEHLHLSHLLCCDTPERPCLPEGLGSFLNHLDWPIMKVISVSDRFCSVRSTWTLESLERLSKS